MSTLFPVAGSKIYVGSVPKATEIDDFTASDFSGVTWVEVDGWTQMGAVGDQAETIRTNLINRGRTVKQKGTSDAGSMENVFALVPDDEGQQLLFQYNATDLEYPFRIVFDDQPIAVSPAVGVATNIYFTGLVNGTRLAGGEANTVHQINSTFEINSNVVTTYAHIET